MSSPVYEKSPNASNESPNAPNISINELEDLNSSLDVLFKQCTECTEEFPSLEILAEAKECLEYLSHSGILPRQKIYLSSISWPTHLRIIIRRLFQCFNIPEHYISINYELCNSAAQVLGPEWLRSDPVFLRLMSSLSSGRLRIIMDEPSKVNLSQLIACLELQEYFIRCVEDEQTWISDEDATSVSKFCAETAIFICEYVIEANKKFDISAEPNVFLPIYKFICVVLSIGGGQLVGNELLNQVLPALLKICQYCIDQRYIPLAGYLLSKITEFDLLQDNILQLILDYIKLHLSSDAKEAVIQLSVLLEELRERKGWWTKDSLREFDNLIRDLNDLELTKLAKCIFKDE